MILASSLFSIDACDFWTLIIALLQPNPNLRYEKMLLSKIDSTNTLGRPTDESQYQGLGRTLEATSTSQKPHNEKVISRLFSKRRHVISWGPHVTNNLVCWSIRRYWSIATWNCEKRNDICQWYKRSCLEAISLIPRKWLQNNFQGLYHF